MVVHGGTSDLEVVHHAAEAFNNPVMLLGDLGRAALGTFCFASLDAGNVALETVKKAETGDGLILRLFEHANRRARATITFGLPVTSVRIVNTDGGGAAIPPAADRQRGHAGPAPV